MTVEALGGGLGFLLSRTAQLWRGSVAVALRPHELTPAQFMVMAALRHRARAGRSGLTQREIGERTGMDPNTTSQVARSLAERRLLRRERHPADNRAVALALTADGLAVMNRCSAAVRQVSAEFFAGVDQESLALVLRDLMARHDG